MTQLINNRYHYDRGYIVLPIELDVSSLPTSLDRVNKQLTLKDEFHVTLLNLNQFSDSKKNLLIEEFSDYTNEFNIEFRSLTPSFWLLQKDNQASLIQMCEVSGNEGFIIHCNEKFGFVIPGQPTHVTLYTSSGSQGIAVNNHDELCQYGQEVRQPFSGY